MIEVRGATFSYPSAKGEPKFLFEDLNLFIPRGGHVALMGPNGSGKSTLGKMIKGLLSPSSGQVLIAGHPLKTGEISPRVGYVFSNPENQIVSSVVEEDIAFGLENMGMDPSTIAIRVRECLGLVDMEDYRFHAPHLLSGGQQQKIVLAGVLAMESEVLVLDEPTSMLDLQDRRGMLDLLEKIHGEGGRTILHITHYFEEALRAQEFMYLDQGRISYYGPWEKFFSLELERDSLRVAFPPLLHLIQGLRERGHLIPPKVRSLEELKEFLLQSSTSGCTSF
ncbi:MAG: ATP-binding cassette domain-containing protein [Deltaproteobacteria bacterium]|nr:ATP-binding cassette domain-containing protein [Deltaproteobacteria bacterium]